MRKKLVIMVALTGIFVACFGMQDVGAEERVFRVMTGGLKGQPPGQADLIHVIVGPPFWPPDAFPLGANNLPLAAGGFVRDYNLGNPTYGRHTNGAVKNKDFINPTFTFVVYTVAEIDAKEKRNRSAGFGCLGAVAGCLLP